MTMAEFRSGPGTTSRAGGAVLFEKSVISLYPSEPVGGRCIAPLDHRCIQKMVWGGRDTI